MDGKNLGAVNNLAVDANLFTVPYAVMDIRLAMLFFYNGLHCQIYFLDGAHRAVFPDKDG